MVIVTILTINRHMCVIERRHVTSDRISRYNLIFLIPNMFTYYIHYIIRAWSHIVAIYFCEGRLITRIWLCRWPVMLKSKCSHFLESRTRSVSFKERIAMHRIVLVKRVAFLFVHSEHSGTNFRECSCAAWIAVWDAHLGTVMSISGGGPALTEAALLVCMHIGALLISAVVAICTASFVRLIASQCIASNSNTHATSCCNTPLICSAAEHKAHGGASPEYTRVRQS